MKVGILAGGLGTRLAEETEIRPKPMVEIGNMPMLWHIMKIYDHFGYREFCVAIGYKGEYIKRWFSDYLAAGGSWTVETGREPKQHLDRMRELPDWKVHLIETGDRVCTGGRIKRMRPWLGEETCMVTWGDGVANIDLNKLLAFHRSHKKLATVTAVRPPARYGHMEFDGDRITSFTEKPQTGEGWINGAFFVLEPEVHDFIEGDNEMFEHEPLSRLAKAGQLMAYRHTSFWQCMDTMREKRILQQMWDSGEAPWKTWSEAS